MAVKNFVNGQIVLTDGTAPAAVSLTLPLDRGDFELTDVLPTLNEVVIHERRGLFESIGDGARLFPKISFTCYMAEFTNASGSSARDFLFFDGAYTGNTSTTANAARNTVDLTFNCEGTEYGDGADHSFGAADCVLTSFSFAEGNENVFSFELTVLGALTGDIVAAETTGGYTA